MQTYLIDTNILVRFFVGDNLIQQNQARKYLEDAKHNKVILQIPTEVLIEIEYVLKKVYHYQRADIAYFLESIVTAEYLKIADRSELMEAVQKYKTSTVDLVDCILFTRAKQNKLKILSFDRDFEKLY